MRQALRAIPSPADRLPSPLQSRMERSLGSDFDAVRVHTDSNAALAADALGANAFATGRDIYFNRGRYDPRTPHGERLLAHELAHVAQQGGADTGAIQCDLMMSLPSALGVFEMGMASRTAPMTPGMQGDIRFLPDPTGPYATQIGLIQMASVTQQAGPAAGTPFDWSGSPEAARNDLMTTGLGVAPPGHFIDAQTATHLPSTPARPEYLEQWGAVPGVNEYGWLRSPTDVHATSLRDYPQWTVDSDFDFETVAKAADTQAVYGSLEWGFEIRSGVVGHEYAHTMGAESATFDEALERFRGFYAHEPVVIYFDTNIDTPIAGEEGKIREFLPYLARYPDVRISIDGYADERGTVAHNSDLSLRRGLNVEALCVSLGVDPSRIETPIGLGATTTFSAGSSSALAGSLRANRRVVISFERTASTPIVGP